jgi:hypothetical protein
VKLQARLRQVQLIIAQSFAQWDEGQGGSPLGKIGNFAGFRR